MVERCGPQFDQRFANAGLWVGYVFVDEHIWPAFFVETYGAQGKAL